jgi:hypothetical protein
VISITKIDKQVKYCRGDSYPKRSCSMRKSGKDKGCLPPGNPPASCDPGRSPVADQGWPVSGPQVQELMCLVGHFLSQREHGEVWRAVESKMSAADRVVPPEGSFWDKHAYLNPAPDRRQRYRLPHFAMLPKVSQDLALRSSISTSGEGSCPIHAPSCRTPP